MAEDCRACDAEMHGYCEQPYRGAGEDEWVCCCFIPPPSWHPTDRSVEPKADDDGVVRE
jgi:hypothetical protein